MQKVSLHRPDATFTDAPASYCTITVSDLAEIPAKVARVYYDEPRDRKSVV